MAVQSHAGIWFWFFLISTAAYFSLKWALNIRQQKYIQQHLTNIPSPFDQIIDEQQQKFAGQYALAKLKLTQIELGVSTVILLLWTWGGGLSKLSNLITSWLPNHPIHLGVVFMLGFITIGSIIDLPFGWYRQFVLEERFHFNRQTLSSWLADLVKSTAVGALIGVPVLYLLVYVMSIMGGSWWLYAWVLLIAFNALMLWLHPSFIAPLFNKFSPLPEGELADRLNRLLQKCHFKSGGMFIMDGSRRSGHGNAYFTGFGQKRRIVLYDTLVKQLNPNQLEAVLAHELGHFHHQHIKKRLFWMIPISFLVFAILGALSSQTWFFEGLGYPLTQGVASSQTTHAVMNTLVALILFTLILPNFMLFFAPLMSKGSRAHEFEADRFATEHSNGQDLIDALIHLYKENSSFVGTEPWYSLFYDSHPPALVRIQAIHQLLGQLATQDSASAIKS